MNWFDSLIFEIKWFFKLNWPILLFTLFLLCVVLGLYSFMKNYEPPPERIEVEAQGVISGIRNTGAFCIYDTEIKFTDGSIIMLQYSTVRHHKLKHGQSIKIIYSSRRGRVIKINKQTKREKENGPNKL